MNQVKSKNDAKGKKTTSLKAKQLSLSHQVILLKIDKTLNKEVENNSISDKTKFLKNTFVTSAITR